jgi:hypothetical protein
VFNAKVRKYLVSGCNDSPKLHYQARGSFCGTASCPSNPKKTSYISCSVKFSVENNVISNLRIVCVGPPALLAAGNFAAQRAKKSPLSVLQKASRMVEIEKNFNLAVGLAQAQGVWALEKAVDVAVTYYNNLTI